LRGRSPEERYNDAIRIQKRDLAEFEAHEIEWANYLIRWYRNKKKEMPDIEYRGCAFFLNKEYLSKPGSLALLYSMYQRCMNELPKPTKELAFEILAFRFRLYAQTLEKGGFGGWGNNG
jgi:hypothetical protein